MMNYRTLGACAATALALTLAGCGGGDSPAPDAVKPPSAVQAPDPDLDKAIKLANAISARPDDSGSILAEAGMTIEQLEALLAEIAADPARSAAYASAVR